MFGCWENRGKCRKIGEIIYFFFFKIKDKKEDDFKIKLGGC